MCAMDARNKQPEQVRVDIDEVVHETHAAILVRLAHDHRKEWLPFSQVHSIHRESSPPHIYVTPWIAKQKGLL